MMVKGNSLDYTFYPTSRNFNDKINIFPIWTFYLGVQRVELIDMFLDNDF